MNIFLNSYSVYATGPLLYPYTGMGVITGRALWGRTLLGVDTELARGYSNKVVVTAKKRFFGIIKVGLVFFDKSLKYTYIKYKGIIRRKLIWTI